MEEGLEREGGKDFILSPGECSHIFIYPTFQTNASSTVIGLPRSPPRLLYTLPVFAPTLKGTFFVMASTNRAIVQRTWGLHELQVRRTKLQSSSSGPGPESRAEQQRLTYGRQFKYNEFMVMPNTASAIIVGIAIAIVFAALMFLPPVSPFVFGSDIIG